MASDNTNAEYRAKYLRLLMERVRADRHPSTTHMDLIEQALPPQWIPDYLDILLEKIADDGQPSISMLKRIGMLVERVPQTVR
jgi:hypothetical protein